MRNREARIMNTCGLRNSFRIAIDGEQAATRPEPRENRPAVPAATECRIDIHTVGSQCQRVERRLEQNRDVRRVTGLDHVSTSCRPLMPGFPLRGTCSESETVPALLPLGPFTCFFRHSRIPVPDFEMRQVSHEGQ